MLSLVGSFDTADGVAPSPIRPHWCIFLESENKWKLILLGKSCRTPLRSCPSLGVTELKAVFDAGPWDFSNFHAWGAGRGAFSRVKFVCAIRNSGPVSAGTRMDCVILNRLLNLLICTFLEVHLLLEAQ